MKHSTVFVMGVAAVVGFVGYVFGHKQAKAELATSGPALRHRPTHRPHHHHHKHEHCPINYSGLTHSQVQTIQGALKAGSQTCEQARLSAGHHRIENCHLLADYEYKLTHDQIRQIEVKLRRGTISCEQARLEADQLSVQASLQSFAP